MKKYRIKRGIEVIRVNDTIYFGWSPDICYKIKNVGKLEELFVSLLDGNYSVDEIFQKLKNVNPKIHKSEVIHSLSTLTSAGIVETISAKRDKIPLSPLELEFYDRTLLYFDIAGIINKNLHNSKYEYLRKLKNSKVLLLGLGGVGSMEAYYLSASGIGYIKGIDYDNVEYSNINRSFLFSTDDIGRPKTEVLQEKIKKINPFIKFETDNVKITSKSTLLEVIESIPHWDFIVRGLDRPPEIREWLNEICVKKGIPYTGGGYIECSGVIGPTYIPKSTSCYECMNIFLAQHSPGKCKQLLQHIYNAASFGPPTGFIASFVSLEVIKYLTGISPPETCGRRYIISFHPFKVTYQNIPIISTCPVCQKKGQ